MTVICKERVMSNQFGIVGILDKWTKNDPPGNQMIYITLDEYTKLKNQSILLTPQLACDAEVDYEIDRIIKELETIRKKAKANIKRTNERIKNAVSERVQQRRK